MDLTKLKRHLDSQQADRDSKQLPNARLRFDPPSSVTKASYQLPGHGLLFCVHGKPYSEPCSSSTCRRTKREAQDWLNRFMAEVGKNA